MSLTLVCVACKVQQDAAPESKANSAQHVPGNGRDAFRFLAAPDTGDVASEVRDALRNAALEKRRLVVYVGATWCEPCRRVHDAAEHGELDADFGNIDLLEFDLDRDGERLSSAGYKSQYIPLFALPSADGTASGRQVEGAVKGEGAMAFIRPRLAQLLAR